MAGYTAESAAAAPIPETTEEKVVVVAAEEDKDTEKEKDKDKPKKSSTKIKTKASKEAARFSDDAKASQILRGPSENGNEFDVRMSEEADGAKSAAKIIKILKEKGICVVLANAPQELVLAANREAEDLWEDGKFTSPMRISDDRSKLEAMCWQDALYDEEKVCYVRTKEDSAEAMQSKAALRALMGNMADFGGGLGEGIAKELGVKFDRFGHAMLSCYTGDKSYRLHIDNPHLCGDPERPTIADNGMRLTMAYYINCNWDNEVCDPAGGLDVYLSDATKIPPSAASAKTSGKHRIAPHADTLVLYLSERMAHHVVPTHGTSDKWFCMTMWYLDGKAQGEAPKKLLKMQQELQKELKGNDSDSD